MQRWSVPNSIGVISLFLLILFANNVVASDQNSNSVQRLDAIIIDILPHSNTSWTQGLLINDGYLYESTGKYGESSLQKINMSNGEIEKSFNHNESIFAEGLTFYDNKLIQLTYRSNIAFVFDIETFEIINTWNYTGEGWGICTMPDYFVMSNGTSQLTLRDLQTFEIIDVKNVTKNGTPVSYLNELECVENTVYSNVWLTDEIILIDIDSGNVTNTVKLDGLLNKSKYDQADVLNGIAFDKNSSEFTITGKYWPYFYNVFFEENYTVNNTIITNETIIDELDKNQLDPNIQSDINQNFLTYSLIFSLFICIVIWLIDIKLRVKPEKTQVQDGGGK
tara:strand:+ start:6562 stop:7569 length:1008 start_codon:yes stop_codon:yes gene_type:complete